MRVWTSKNFPMIAFVAIAIVAAGLGCGGGTQCVGELQIDGKTYQGKDPVEAQARQNTCSKYCIEGDSGYDRLYQEFVKTPEAKKIPGLDKWAAQSQDKKLGEYVKQCEQQCLKEKKIAVRCE